MKSSMSVMTSTQMSQVRSFSVLVRGRLEAARARLTQASTRYCGTGEYNIKTHFGDRSKKFLGRAG